MREHISDEKSADQDYHLIRDEAPHSYRTELPNILLDPSHPVYGGLSVYDLVLYTVYKRTASDEGRSWKGVRQLALEARMSVGQVSKSHRRLLEMKLIRENRLANRMRETYITDIWPENYQWFKQRSSSEPAVHPMNGCSPPEPDCSPGETGVHSMKQVVHGVNKRRTLEEEPVRRTSEERVCVGVKTPNPQTRVNHHTEIDSAFRERMRAEFGATLPDVDDAIDNALGHKACDKWKDKQRYVLNWLKRDAQQADRSPPRQRDPEFAAYGRPRKSATSSNCHDGGGDSDGDQGDRWDGWEERLKASQARRLLAMSGNGAG